MPGGTTLTLGAGLTVHGQSGFVGSPNGGAFINEGTISADLAGQPAGSTAAGTLVLTGTGWSNSGKLEVSNNETLVADGTGWSNTGSFTINAATLDIGSINGGGPGSFTTAGLGIFCAGPGEFVQPHRWHGESDGDPGQYRQHPAARQPHRHRNVAGGTIIGGTITTSGSNVLIAGNTSETLTGVTLNGHPRHG